MHRLYQREGAGRPPRVRWALEEAGAPYEYVVLTKDEGSRDEHAARHPLRRVPALESDTGTLFESAALCLQIADLYPEAELIPAIGTHARGQVYQWSFFAMTELEPAVLRAYIETHAAVPDPEAVTKAEARLAKAAAALAGALDGHDYLVDDRFTIADVVMGGVLHSARRLELMPDSPTLVAYLTRLDGREAKQRAYAA
ncbi:MAG TPA: glutathione S-transferase family protein [Gaiellaceae bacterium]|nr:glutathione S-transferase family protein [Gaiellaceae bacterium]